MSDASAFLETADRIGRRLCRDAFWHDRRCAWLGWGLEPVNGALQPVYRAFGADLYKGSAGVALFLARLWQATGDAVARKTVSGALSQMLSEPTPQWEAGRCGFYSGCSGVAYALLEMGKIFGKEDLVEEGLTLLASLANAKPAEVGADVISGVAGVTPTLLAAARDWDRPQLADIAAGFGQWLLDAAVRSEHGWSWKTIEAPAARHLTGYSHGVAGIALALLALAKTTGEARFRRGASEALRYERAFFDEKRGNWPDFRIQGQESDRQTPTWPVSWCHGAPGIGLSRLYARQLLDGDEAMDGEIEAAIGAVAGELADPSLWERGNFSLCHGVAGNAELLADAAAMTDRPELRRIAEDAAREGARRFENRRMPWPCGVLHARETPGLMLGLAGIGHFYLRLFDRERVPSALVVLPKWGG